MARLDNGRTHGTGFGVCRFHVGSDAANTDYDSSAEPTDGAESTGNADAGASSG
jgi:hypothetical protein